MKIRIPEAIKGDYILGRYFGTDGIRGEANTELTLETAVKIGQWLGWYYSRQHEGKAKVLIGRDTRLSGSMFELGLAAGAVSTGADVWLLGVCPTPAVSYVVSTEDFDCGIMVSASHNPYVDNGIKILNHKGSKMEEELLVQIEDYIDGITSIDLAGQSEIGIYYNYPEGLDHYRRWLEQVCPTRLDGLKIALDLANGSACTTAKKALEELGAEVLCIHNEPNGININYHCGSTHPESLQQFVVENGCDAGLAFDGDADRLIAVDNNGRLINGDYILYILGNYMKDTDQLEKNTVVTTVMANLGLYKALEASGIDYIQTPVGDKYVYEEMDKNGYILGGEQSGHIIFSKDEMTGDGLMTALKLLDVVVATGKSIPELSEGLTIYPQLLVNIRVKDKNTVLEDEDIWKAVKEVEEELADNGRILVRPSGTEPLIRIMTEALSDELCRKYTDKVANVLYAKGYAA